jgi:hypothetical protein
MPVDFQQNLAKYDAERAIVFTGIDFFVVWLWLMLGRYDLLANRVVQLGDQPRSKEEIIRLLRSRTSWTRTKPVERLEGDAVPS